MGEQLEREKLAEVEMLRRRIVVGVLVVSVIGLLG